MNTLILAADAAVTNTAFWEKFVVPGGQALAFFSVLVGLFFIAKNAMAQRSSGVVKSVVGMVFAAALLYNLSAIGTIIDLGWAIISTVIESIGDLFGIGGE